MCRNSCSYYCFVTMSFSPTNNSCCLHRPSWSNVAHLRLWSLQITSNDYFLYDLVDCISVPWTAVIHVTDFNTCRSSPAASWTHAYYLSELPGDADGPADAVAADEQSLQGPACKVAECEDVEVAQDPIPCYHRTVHSIFLEGEMWLNYKNTTATKKWKHFYSCKGRAGSVLILIYYNPKTYIHIQFLKIARKCVWE